MLSLVISCVYLINHKTLEKEVFEAAWKKVNEYRYLFLKIPTFTYMRVGCFNDHPYMLPWYPTDRIILIELARQLMAVCISASST